MRNTGSNGKQIVVVEHPAVRRKVRNLLTKEGYTVAEVNASEVGRYMKEHGRQVGLVITNRMDCTGLLRKGPLVVCLWNGADGDPDWLCQQQNCVVLRKPVGARALVKAVRESRAGKPPAP